MNSALVLHGALRIHNPVRDPAVAFAAARFAEDCAKVLGQVAAVAAEGPGLIALGIDSGSLPHAETWRFVVAPDGIRIDGADVLGLIFGMYAFSERCLGVDPLYFWKDIAPEQRETLEIPCQVVFSEPPLFRYRGWFINDEDLLSEYLEPSGARTIDYPFYAHVVNLGLLDRVFEALLRLGGNLIIPASFLDVMNPPEAAIAKRAAEHGLFVSQHHIEALGVSHFSYENYWRRKGVETRMLYSTEPDRVRETWRAYAEKWYELVGDRVVWQLGLRGRGDAPVWTADKNITAATGADFINRAMADQWAILRDVDPRPNPPATTTLFLEGAQLMADGLLSFPEGLTIVFADAGHTQEMQEDFRDCPRLPKHRYGEYFHVAFWRRGPHLIQGSDPVHVRSMFAQWEAKGDTEYVIANVSNVREHVLGAHTFLRTAWHGAERPLAETLDEFGPRALQQLLRSFHDTMPRNRDGTRMQDGDCTEVVDICVRRRREKATFEPDKLRAPPPSPETLRAASGKLLALADEADAAGLSPQWQAFASGYVGCQARALAALYRAVAQLIGPEGPKYRESADEIDSALDALAPLAEGRWTNWYRGERKAHWKGLMAELRT